MKLLAVSLLRVGDFIMQESVIDSLQSQFPGAELHLLVNDVSEKYVQQSGKYKNIHVLPRHRLQRFLVQEERPKLAAFLNLSEFIEELNKNKFDLVINLSHTTFSARLLDLIAAKEKRGMHFVEGKLARPQNPWAQHLNENFSRNKNSAFQGTELLAHSVGAAISSSRPVRKVSEIKNLAVQIMTSDEKKTWPVKNFIELIALLQSEFPKIKIFLVGAPDEEEQLRKNFSENKNLKIQILKWRELKTFLSSTDLLLTGDTSVQHLAAQVGTPIFSLFLGSANPEKTAPMQYGAYVLQPRTSCTPCKHSEKCFQPRHICGEDLRVENVFTVLKSVISHQSLPDVGSHVYQVSRGQSGMFQLKKLGKGAEMINLKKSLEQLCWQIYLDGGHLQVAGPYGSAAYIFIQENAAFLKQEYLKQALIGRWSEIQSHELFLKEFEGSVLRQFTPALLNGALKDSGLDSVLADQVNDHLFENPSGKDYFFNLLQQLKDADLGFSQVKKIKQAIHETKYLIEIELKLIKSITMEIKERNFSYVSGTRNLSEIGPTAP